MIRLSGLINLKELISEEERYYARDPKGKQISVFTDKDNWKKAVSRGGYEEVDREEAEKELAQQKGAKPEAPPEEKPKPKMTKIAADPFADDELVPGKTWYSDEEGDEYDKDDWYKDEPEREPEDKLSGDAPPKELEKGTKVTASWEGLTGKHQEISDGEIEGVKHTERGMEYIIRWNNGSNLIQLPADYVTSEEEPREKPSGKPEEFDNEFKQLSQTYLDADDYMAQNDFVEDFLRQFKGADLGDEEQEMYDDLKTAYEDGDNEGMDMILGAYDDELVPGKTWYSDEEGDEYDKDDWYKDESIIKNVGFKKYVSEMHGISQKKVNKPSIIKKKSKQPLVEQIKKDIDNSSVKKLVNQIIS